MPTSTTAPTLTYRTLLFVSWTMALLLRDTECYPGIPPSTAFIVITNFLSRDLYSI